MSNYNKWKEFCSQQDSCDSCKYKGDCDCEVEFWKDWARADERAKVLDKIDAIIDFIKNNSFDHHLKFDKFKVIGSSTVISLLAQLKEQKNGNE